MRPSTVTVYGVIRTPDGDLYEGAVIEASLRQPFTAAGSVINAPPVRTFSNSYGRFQMKLVPSTLDGAGTNYYQFKIVHNEVVMYDKQVTGNPGDIINFENLPAYSPTPFSDSFVGDDIIGSSAIQVTLPENLEGTFTWTQQSGDGSNRIFAVPGTVAIVALNGIIQTEGPDYRKVNIHTVEFSYPPSDTDNVLVQYRID